MIEARVDTIIRGVESIGGGLCLGELAERERRVREARDPETARYCENPECWAKEYDDGQPQRLHSYNYFVVDKGAYTGRDWSNYCSRCTRTMKEALENEAIVASLAKLETHSVKIPFADKCNRGHDLTVPGAYSGGRCKECKNKRRRIPRMSHRDGYIDLPGLLFAKKRWGGTFLELETATGYNHNTIKSWAHFTSAAPEEAIENLARVLGCTAVELTEEVG